MTRGIVTMSAAGSGASPQGPPGRVGLQSIWAIVREVTVFQSTCWRMAAASTAAGTHSDRAGSRSRVQPRPAPAVAVNTACVNPPSATRTQSARSSPAEPPWRAARVR